MEIGRKTETRTRVELPQVYTCSMKAREAGVRAAAAKYFKGVTFELVKDLPVTKGRVIGQTTVTDWNDLASFNQLLGYVPYGSPFD